MSYNRSEEFLKDIYFAYIWYGRERQVEERGWGHWKRDNEVSKWRNWNGLSREDKAIAGVCINKYMEVLDKWGLHRDVIRGLIRYFDYCWEWDKEIDPKIAELCLELNDCVKKYDDNLVIRFL